MNCVSCGRANRDGARFCGGCGGSLAPRCPACGAETEADARFCDACGGSLVIQPAAAAGARKVVSIVFADLVGSTALHERLDPESARRFMESYYDATRGAVELHGGTVTQLLGDGVKAVFGIPRVAEDDAIRAVRAAVAMQEAFRALADEQRGAVGKTGLRVAVNTGEVVANDATEIIGDPVNVAARLQEQGKDGDVVVGESTHRLVSTLVTLELLGSFALKGRSEAVKAYRVVSLDRPAGAATAPFVGRDEELARLTAVYATAVEKPAAGLAVLLGSPGLGKSRLIDEFARRRADTATVVRAHCDAAGGATFAPLAQALRGLLGIEDGASAESLRATIEGALPVEEGDRARIAGGIASLLAASPASPEETFFVVRRLLGALAQTKPVVLVIDDLHWAEPLLLDLVEHLIQWGSGVALFVLIGARPELRDLRSSLVTPGGLVADVVTLHGLDAGAAMRLAANVIGASDLPAAIAAKVLATSEGNPLFVGELVRMLVQEGALLKDGDRWTVGANLAALEMPPTIHALLAARIERLRPEERTLLERAAVVGRHFSRSAVAALLPQSGDLDARLEALRRSELIERDTGWLLGEPVLRFHHVLIRDAAYRRLLKGTRAELHAQLADWIEAQVGDAPEHDETIGWHLEQAHAFLRELGPLDENGRRLGERAATRLAAAGRRALAGDDVPLAASLLGRAIDRLDAEDPARADLALDWCEALLSAGDVVPAADAIAELGRFSADSERLRAWQICFASQLTVLTAPQGLQAAADAVAGAAQQLTAQGDAAGEAKAHSVHAQALARLGKVGACEAALDQALAAARRAGDRRRANAVLAGAPLAALWGPSPVTRASGRCLDVVRVLRITQGAPAVEAVALSCQGVLEALRGRTDAARRMIASARKMVEELGIASRLFEADVFAGRIEAMEGDAVAAERLLRGAYDGLRDLGLGIDAAQAGALLARVLLAQDRVAEALALSHESEALAGDDLQAAIAWRGVRAEALAKRGEHEAAIELAKAAVAIASATDALLDHARARMALAAALRAAARDAEADAEERRAIELWEAKGATLLAERARTQGARVEPIAAPHEPSREPVHLTRRIVHPNSASANAARVDAAFAERNADAFPTLLADQVEVTHHPTGVVYDRGGVLRTWHSLLMAEDVTYASELFATLGDSLALCRRMSRSFGGLAGEDSAPFGAAESEHFVLIEVDAEGRRRQVEVFALDHLGDAVARFYERHAELLPDGPERTRAAAVARSVAAMASQPDLARRAAVLAPDIEMVDHRTIGTWSASGAAAVVRHFDSIDFVSDEPRLRDHDVLAAGANALLVLRTHTGIDRQSGGEYERRFLMLLVTGPDGSIARIEWFDDDREAEALARFDVLVAGAEPTRPVRRPVRPNAATRGFERFEATLAARDRDALAQHFDESLVVVHHPSGATYGRRAMLATWRSTLKAERFSFRQEILASLGDALALDHHLVSVEGLSEAHLAAFGHAEFDEISLLEVDDRERWLRSEIFAADRLGEAVARLYERYAELLPEGPERDRSAATAHALGTMLVAPADLDRVATVLAPDFESVDHRHLSLWSLRGGDAFVDHMRALHQVATDVVIGVNDVLALGPSAVLVRRMHAGTERVGGGAYERPFLVLFASDADGRLARAEWFEADREAEALARFDELAGSSETAPREHPFANAASRANRRRTDAFNARDWAGVEACVSHDLVFDEQRRMLRNVADRDVWLAQTRLLFDLPESRFTIELVATRGERLSLHRHEFEGTVADGGGPLELDPHLSLHEVDRDGRIVAIVLFDLGDMDAAHAELDARFETNQGAGHERGWRAARALHDAIAWRDWNATVAALAPHFACEDRRRLGWGATLDSREIWVRSQQALAELAPDFRYRFDHVRVSSAGYLTRLAQVGTREGGAFESPFLYVAALEAGGRPERFDVYDAEDVAPALARFAELAAHARAESPFANAASRYNERFVRAWDARDWNAVREMHRPTCRVDDRRRLMRIEGPAEDGFRFFFDQPRSRWIVTPIATRGERLVLSRLVLECDVDAEGGAAAIDYLCVDEVDADGLSAAMVVFDPDDQGAAYAELDARFEAGEGAAYARTLAAWRRREHALAIRNWDALNAMRSPGFVFRDHRLLGWGTPTSHGVSIDQINQSLVDLAPDVHRRHDHVRLCDRGMLEQMAQVGTRDGGAFENVFLAVYELDAQGRSAAIDNYDVDRFDLALARFAELAAPATAESPFANAASRALDELMAAWSARDWDAYARVLAGEYRQFDRRRLVQLALDREQAIAFARQIGEMATTRVEAEELIATRGDRLALSRLRVEAAEGAVGPSEIVSLMLTETNDRGECGGQVRFDVEDLDAAYAELDARYDVLEAALHPQASAWAAAFRRAFASRDWDAMSALQAPDQVANDYRLVGWGALRGAGAWTPTLRELVALAPDVRQRVDHLRATERGLLWHHAWHGTRDGGEFESLLLLVVELDEDGRERRVDVWEADRFDAALARFAEIAVPARTDEAAGHFENAASRAWRAVNDAWTARDLERFAAPHAADLRYRDHRRLFELDLDRAGFLDFTRPLLTMRVGSASLDLVATRGERLALMRSTLTMEDEAVGPSAIDSLMLIETDERGEIAAYDRWDLADEDAAWAELDARWAAGEGARRSGQSASLEFGAALARRDWDAVAACYAPDFVGRDHRLVSWGTVHGPTGLLRTVQEMVALAPDARMRTSHQRACARGAINDITWLGTRDGGAFESPFVSVSEFGADGRIVRADFYDPHHLDRAFARFEELRAGERRDPLAAIARPNAAIAAMDRWHATYDAAFDGGDWEAMRATCAPGFVFDDRRRLALLSGDVELMIASARERIAMGARPERRLRGTAGERVAIEQILWSGGPPDGRFEIEYVCVDEVDESGLLTAIVIFDTDDARAAQREAWARWAAIDPDVAPNLALMSEAADSFHSRDRTRVRALYADDVVVEDHRHAGMGRIEGGDAYANSIAVLWELASTTRVEFGWFWPAIERAGALTTIRRTGDVAGGGAFESDYLYLFLHAHGRITHVELFELDALDAALARFARRASDPPAASVLGGGSYR